MKTKLIAVGLMAILILPLAACSSTPKETPKEITIVGGGSSGEAGATMAVGDSLTLILESNPSTGYQWSEQAAIIGTSSIGAEVEQTEHKYVAPDSKDNMLVGASGQEQWTFKAVNKGTATIFLSYGRSWESKAEKTFKLTVTVK